MAEFAYNSAKNASTGYISFEWNYSYHSYVFYKKDINPHFQSKLANDLANKLKELMVVCQKNF